MIFLLLSLFASAADPQPTVVLPSAAELPARTGETSWGLVGGFGALSERSWVDGGVLMQGVWGASNRLALTGSALGSPFSRSTWGGVGASYVVYDGSLRVAPFGVVLARVHFAEDESALLYALGIAVEGGWSRVRLDASVPLVGGLRGADAEAGPTGLPGPLVLATLEAGVSIVLGAPATPAAAHTLRLGTLSVLPAIGWRYEGARWHIETTAASLGVASALSVRAGVGL